MSSKVIEVIPTALKILNRDGSLNVADFIRDHTDELEKTPTPKTITNYLNMIEEHQLQNAYQYDESRKVWVVNKHKFLDKEVLSAEEIVLASAIQNNNHTYGYSLSSTLDNMLKRFLRRGKSPVIKQMTLEKTEPLSERFALLQSAIDQKKKIRFEFKGSFRTVQPYRYFNVEYYWYLAGYEEKKVNMHTLQPSDERSRMKSYTVSHIDAIEILDEDIDQDFIGAAKKIAYATNGFIDWHNDPIEVVLLVSHKLKDHLSRAMFYRRWEYYGPSAAMEGFDIYKVPSVAEKYEDIIPTILKHSPDILVMQPEELYEKVKERIEIHKEMLTIGIHNKDIDLA